MLPSDGRPRPLAALALVALVVTAGCLADPIGAGTTATTDATTTEPTATEATTTADTERTTGDQHSGTDVGSTHETTSRNDLSVSYERAGDGPDLASGLPEPTACDGVWVSYWGTGDVQMLWGEDGQLRVGWTVPANQSILFVAFENETAVGADHVRYEESSVTADGAGVPVGDDDGEGRYAVVAMHDVNGNGEYDAGTDRPCRSDADDQAIVVTDWLWVDWDADD